MNSMQYQNILKWSAYGLSGKKELPPLAAIRCFFDNLGVAFPHGDLRAIRTALETNRFLGWRKCPAEEAQPYADVGIPTVGLADGRVFLVPPDPKTEDLTLEPEVKRAKHPCVKHTGELTPEEREKTVFFTYRYGFVLGKEKR